MSSNKIYKYKGYTIEERRCNDHLTDFDITTKDDYLVSRFTIHDRYIKDKKFFFDEQIETFQRCIDKGIIRLEE